MNRINDIVFLTTEDVEMVPEEAAGHEVLDQFHKSGTREVVVKDADQLCTISTAGQFIEVAADKVEIVVDTNAASENIIVY